MSELLARPDRARFFYTGSAVAMLILTFIGFQQFYLHGNTFVGGPLTPQLRTVVILHGIFMSAWILLFLVQPILVVANSRRTHMFIGKIGAVLAICNLLLGLWVGVESSRYWEPDAMFWGFTGKQFMAIPVFAILSYASFVAIGVWQRRRPEIHRPMMLMATLMAVEAAFFRMWPNFLYQGTILQVVFGPALGMLAFGLLLFVTHSLLTRSFDRWFAAGYVGMAASCILMNQIAGTSAWFRIATFLQQ